MGKNFNMNIGKGENTFDASGLVAAGVGMLGEGLMSLSNKY
jgi:hypothetical protein